MRGNTDRPVEILEKDEFQIEPYVTGLAEFIEECDTPMTIAIQGDWGCGKTSMMNMTRDYLKQKKDIVDVWFNTWQFSQFNMDGQLVVTFLQHMAGELSKKIGDMDIKKKMTDKFAPILKNITVGMTKQFIGSDIGDVVDSMLTKSKLDIVDEISELRSNFQELVMKATAEGEKRVVVFIDDLDRLQPVRAVELLEILKLFMDCDKCVFVMAIDTSVVFQGIREKYGKDMSDEKAQSFFDKMIQMPFKMPIAYYRFGGMMERLLDFLQEEGMSAKDKTEYVKLIKRVTDGNPRSIKRLANSILLTEKVAERKNVYKSQPADRKLIIRQIFVTLSCIQMKYEDTYNFLVNDMTYLRMNNILSMALPKEDDAKRGELLIQRFDEIGMPGLEIEDKLVFYDVIRQYIKILQSYIECSRKYNIMQKPAVEELLRIVSLNNVAEELDEVQRTSGRMSHVSEVQREVKEALKYECIAKCVEGKYEEVYEMLAQQGLYLPVSWLKKIGNHEDKIKEMQKNVQSIEQCALFAKIDEVLFQYDSERKVTLSQATGDYRISYERSFNTASIKIQLGYNPVDRYLSLESRITGSDMKPMEETSIFVDKLLDIYNTLQATYSKELVRDIGKSAIEKELDEEGGIKKLSFSYFPIIHEDMANAIVEYATYAFTNMENYYQKQERGYVSMEGNSALAALLKAAEGVPSK